VAYNAPSEQRFQKIRYGRNQSTHGAFTGGNNGQPDTGAGHCANGLARAEPEQQGEKSTMTKKESATEAAGQRGPAMADPLGANSEIGRKLKQYYDELVSDNVPDRFAQLLSQLEQAEPARKKD
jgi:hypothetical protein